MIHQENDVTLTLLLPWFPIVLGVGVGGRLLGRSRGFALGFLCALFWIALVQASAGTGIWTQPWIVMSITAGAFAIFAMGGWSGQGPVSEHAFPNSSPIAEEARPIRVSEPPQPVTGNAYEAIDQFDDWLGEHGSDSNPWPAFDEFVRKVLYERCRATHVRPYRLLSESEALIPLRDPDPLADEKPLSAREGIAGHVVTTGRPYLVNDGRQGDLVAELAAKSAEPPLWCFAIKKGTRRIGLVTVNHLDIAPERNQVLLHTVERLITQFWCMLEAVVQGRSAVLADPVSGLYAREAFLRVAEQSLQEAYAQGEPVAVAVLAIEHLRQLNDSGRWEVADQLVREVSTVLHRKVRSDDRLGRFDGSRFIALFRRVDSELASLIVTQIAQRLGVVCSDESRWGARIGIRCGVVGSGTEQPPLRAMITGALSACRRARVADEPVASDIHPALETSESGP